MKRIIIAILGLFLCGCQVSKSYYQIPVDVAYQNIALDNELTDLYLPSCQQTVSVVGGYGEVQTGFLVRRQGEAHYLLTTFLSHQQIRVVTYDNRSFTASIVGSHRGYNMSVYLFSSSTFYPVAEFASEVGEVGSMAYTISTIGFQQFNNSLFVGHIAARERSATLVSTVGDVLREDLLLVGEADLPFNPGSQGSPLFDTSGSVQGMLSFRPEASEGISFFIDVTSSGVYLPLVDEIIDAVPSQRLSYFDLGIDGYFASSYPNPFGANYGFLVVTTTPEGPMKGMTPQVQARFLLVAVSCGGEWVEFRHSSDLPRLLIGFYKGQSLEFVVKHQVMGRLEVVVPL